MIRCWLNTTLGLALFVLPAGCGTGVRVTPANSTAGELDRLNRDVAFYQRRIAGDPGGALDRAALAGLYLQRARVTGNPTDLERAESMARESSRRMTAHNAKAGYILAAALLGQHRFVEAGEAARRLVAEQPDVTSYRGLLGEIALELGDYAGADSIFLPLARALPPDAGLETIARLARWEELRGDLKGAESRLEGALVLADAAPNLSPEERAWFHLRRGDLAFRHGQPAEAERQYRLGWHERPGDRRIALAQSRLEAARHHWGAAVAWGETAVAALPEPAALAALGEARFGAGDSAGAEVCFRRVEATAFAAPFNRAATALLADRGRRVAEVVTRLEQEIQERSDAQGYDLLGWALYRAGRYREAAAAAERALTLSSSDALFEFHAGAIALALDRTDEARGHLTRALALNPLFHPYWPDSARVWLRGLPPPAVLG